MKINEWTLGLAAVGVVSMASVARADEVKLVPLNTALASTTISGYVDTSATWNPGTGNANPAPYAFNAGKQDGFNLDLVDLKISKPLDEGKFSAGYTAEFIFGPDAAAINGSSGASANIREAHVDLRVPIGNGLDFQVGRFGNIIGYESTTSYLNPNYTHSYAWTMEPTEHTGVLATYKINDMFTAQAGVANTLSTGPINGRNFSSAGGTTIESKKAIVSLLTVTAPDSWGFAKGSAFYVGFDHGPGPTPNFGAVHLADRNHLYLGATVNTPLKELTVGASWDSIWDNDVGGVDTGYTSDLNGYASYKLTDKATFSVRGEYVKGSALAYMDAGANGTAVNFADPWNKVLALTATFDYALWANVTSRLEARWDHAVDGSRPFGATNPTTFGGTKKNELMLAANLIYKF